MPPEGQSQPNGSHDAPAHEQPGDPLADFAPLTDEDREADLADEPDNLVPLIRPSGGDPDDEP